MKNLLSVLFGGALALCAILGSPCVSAAETVTYYYTDEQGTALATTDAAGNIVTLADYRPYGVQALGSPTQGPGYTGHVEDADTNLVYMQARYYDASASRFLSIDPIGPSPGALYDFNRYLYGAGNPISMSDPFGRSPSSDSDCEVFHCESFSSSSGGGGGKPIDEETVNRIFKHYSADKNGPATKTPIPPAAMAALIKFLSSPVGAKLVAEMKSNPDDPIYLILGPMNITPFYKYDAGTGTGSVYYFLQVDAYKAMYPNSPDMQTQTLDIILGHEIAHTRQGSHAFGVTYSPKFSLPNEFEVIRKVENPYRQFLRVQLRSGYGDTPLPPPLIER